MERPPELQRFLDRTLQDLLAQDSRARKADLSIALLELEPGSPPRLAHRNGERPVYPASVVKLVYLMAAYAWEEQGRLRIDGALRRELTGMTYKSSNVATQRVVAALTDTQPGPALDGEAYRDFKERRLAVKRWLKTLGIRGIHSIHPTYDGGDISARERQLLQDPGVPGGLSDAEGNLRNRQAMTAVGTAKLLALLASDLALDERRSELVRRHMRRDPAKQPYLTHRIAGGALKTSGVEVYSKTGTWGPIFADAGIIRHVSAKQLVLAVFIESRPAYRGDFIAALAGRCSAALLSSPPD
jgi:beta-lactamase class A